MTEYIATRWYRSPECLLTDGHYGPEMDIWGAGCVLFEIVALFPLFPGSDEVDQVNRIHKVVGTPDQDILAKLKENGSSKISYNFSSMPGIGIKHFIPHATPDCVNLLNKTIIYDHTERLISSDAVDHPYFADLRQKDLRQKEKLAKPKVAKLSLRRKARVGEAKPSSTNANQQTKSKAKERIEKASDGDSGRVTRRVRVVKLQSQKQGEDKVKNTYTTKPSRMSRKNTKKLSTEKPSNNIKNLSNQNRIRRLANNPRQSDKRKESNHPKEQTKNPMSTGTNKYSGIKSSGYGRSASKAQPSKPARARRRQTEDQTSGGTDKTTNLTVAESEAPVRRYQKSSLKKNKLSLADRDKRRERSDYILPKIRA